MISKVVFPWSLCQGEIGLSIENGGSKSVEKVPKNKLQNIIYATPIMLTCHDVSQGSAEESASWQWEDLLNRLKWFKISHAISILKRVLGFWISPKDIVILPA